MRQLHKIVLHVASGTLHATGDSGFAPPAAGPARNVMHGVVQGGVGLGKGIFHGLTGSSTGEPRNPIQTFPSVSFLSMPLCERFGRARCLTLRYSLLLSVWVHPSAEHSVCVCTCVCVCVCVVCRVCVVCVRVRVGCVCVVCVCVV